MSSVLMIVFYTEELRWRECYSIWWQDHYHGKVACWTIATKPYRGRITHHASLVSIQHDFVHIFTGFWPTTDISVQYFVWIEHHVYIIAILTSIAFSVAGTRLETLMLGFHRSRPPTAGPIRHRGLIVLVFGARITSGSAISCRILSTTALKTSSQVTAGHPRSPAVTVRQISHYLRLKTD